MVTKLVQSVPERLEVFMRKVPAISAVATNEAIQRLTSCL